MSYRFLLMIFFCAYHTLLLGQTAILESKGVHHTHEEMIVEGPLKIETTMGILSASRASFTRSQNLSKHYDTLTLQGDITLTFLQHHQLEVSDVLVVKWDSQQQVQTIEAKGEITFKTEDVETDRYFFLQLEGDAWFDLSQHTARFASSAATRDTKSRVFMTDIYDTLHANCVTLHFNPDIKWEPVEVQLDGSVHLSIKSHGGEQEVYAVRASYSQSSSSYLFYGNSLKDVVLIDRIQKIRLNGKRFEMKRGESGEIDFMEGLGRIRLQLDTGDALSEKKRFSLGINTL